MATKAELQEHIRRLEDAFDSLMASHRDCTSGHGFNVEWAKRVEDAANRTRWGHKECHAERWQPIETAPKDGTPVLLSFWAFDTPGGYRITVLGGWNSSDEVWAEFHADDRTSDIYQPTHWMPLPEPPKGGGE